MRQRVFFTADASQCLPRVQSEPALADIPSASSGLSSSNGAVATNGEAGLRLTATVPPSSSSSSSSSSRLVASRQGTLSVEQVAHLNYVLRFRDEQVNRTADVDLVSLVADSHTVIMGDSLSVSVLDPLDFELLGQVVEECRTLCDHAIRLDSISRDAFYAAAFVGVDVKDLSVIDIQKMRDQYLAEARKFTNQTEHSLHRVLRDLGGSERFCSALKDDDDDDDEYELEPNGNGAAAADLGALPKSKAALAKELSSLRNTRELEYDLRVVLCSYCRKSKTEAQDTDFYLHPYVPRNFQGRPMFFCSSCIYNWKDYRDDALVQEQLVLEGEINEEICALCSTTPDELVLCSSCPRSFCTDCLRKNLASSEFERCQEDGDWSCMMCENGLKDLTAIPRAMWSKVQVAAGIKHVWSKGNWQGLWQWINHKTLISGQASGIVQSALAGGPRGLNGIGGSESGKRTQRDRDNGVDELPHQGVGNGSNNVRRSSSSGGKARPPKTKGPRSQSKSASSANGSDRKSKAALKEDSGGGAGGNGVSSHDLPGAVLVVGSFVQARYKEHSKWYPGVVAKAHSNGTFDVQYDDGEYEAHVRPGFVRESGHQLPPVDDSRSESYFFSSYVLQLESTALERASGQTDTEEVCFLCKDGGDLVECDWCPQGAESFKATHPCKKVYHSYCLGFDCPDDVEYVCMRHLCDCCGSKGQTQYLCRFCPVAICTTCASTKGKVCSKLGMTRYLMLDEVKHPISSYERLTKAPQPVIQIACGVCCEQLEKSRQDALKAGASLPEDLIMGVERHWPLRSGQEVRPAAKIFRTIKPVVPSAAEESGEAAGVDQEKERRKQEAKLRRQHQRKEKAKTLHAAEAHETTEDVAGSHESSEAASKRTRVEASSLSSSSSSSSSSLAVANPPQAVQRRQPGQRKPQKPKALWGLPTVQANTLLSLHTQPLCAFDNQGGNSNSNSNSGPQRSSWELAVRSLDNDQRSRLLELDLSDQAGDLADVGDVVDVVDVDGPVAINSGVGSAGDGPLISDADVEDAIIAIWEQEQRRQRTVLEAAFEGGGGPHV